MQRPRRSYSTYWRFLNFNFEYNKYVMTYASIEAVSHHRNILRWLWYGIINLIRNLTSESKSGSDAYIFDTSLTMKIFCENASGSQITCHVPSKPGFLGTRISTWHNHGNTMLTFDHLDVSSEFRRRPFQSALERSSIIMFFRDIWADK